MNLTIYSINLSQNMIDELVEDHSNIVQSLIAHKGLVDESKLESGEINTTDIGG